MCKEKSIFFDICSGGRECGYLHLRGSVAVECQMWPGVGKMERVELGCVVLQSVVNN